MQKDVEIEAIYCPNKDGHQYPLEMAGTCQYACPVDPRQEIVAGDKFALLIGHTEKQGGARNYLGLSEYEFNCGIADRVQQLLKGAVTVLVYKRVEQCIFDGVSALANHMNNNQVLGVISLHFNSFAQGDTPKPVLGSEALILNTGENSTLALSMITKLRSVTSIWGRGIKFILPSDRGYSELQALQDHNIASCIFEPCFGNTENIHSKIIFENSELYVQALAEGISSFINMKTGRKPWTLTK